MLRVSNVAQLSRNTYSTNSGTFSGGIAIAIQFIKIVNMTIALKIGCVNIKIDIRLNLFNGFKMNNAFLVLNRKICLFLLITTQT